MSTPYSLLSLELERKSSNASPANAAAELAAKSTGVAWGSLGERVPSLQVGYVPAF